MDVWSFALRRKESRAFAVAHQGSHAQVFRTVAYAVVAHRAGEDGPCCIGVVGDYDEGVALLTSIREFRLADGSPMFTGGSVLSVPLHPLKHDGAWAANEALFDVAHRAHDPAFLARVRAAQARATNAKSESAMEGFK